VSNNITNHNTIVTIRCGDVGFNSYIIKNTKTRKGVIIDTPDDPVNIMNACNDITVEGIFITHTHPEQLQGLHPIREATGAEVWISAVDANVFNYFTPINSQRPENPFEGESRIEVAGMEIQAIATPGHTPGSCCYLIDNNLFSGETLTSTNGPGCYTPIETLSQTIQSVVDKLFTLPKDVVVYPGLGDPFSLANSEQEYKIFKNRYPSALHGNVLWRTSQE
jgi:glyoxylase-like metal-dependent hydrolase (beta-lactamase superfamily II)